MSYRKYLLFILLSHLIIMTVSADALLSQRKLLQSHNFDQLEKQLQSYNDRYLSAQVSLRDYYWSTATIWVKRDHSNEWLLKSLQEWEKQAPNSAYRHIVTGRYYTDMAYAARGTKWSSEVSPEQFSKMEKYFELADYHLNAGLKINPLILDGHIEKLGILRTSRANRKEVVLVKRLLAYMDTLPNKVKSNVAIWSHFMQCIVPRWGGSYAQMSAIITKENFKKNHDLSDKDVRMLQDTIIYDQISVLMLDENDEDGFKLAKKQIKAKTDYAGIYVLGASAAYNIKKYDYCYRYSLQATERKPWRSFTWRRLGSCAIKLQKWPDANRAYRTKITLDGESQYDIFQLGVTYMYLYQFDKAYAMFKKAEELDPDYLKFTQQYTSYIEKEKRASMGLVGKDIPDLIGEISYVSDGK